MTMCFIVPPLSIRHRLQIIDNPRLRQRNAGISGARLSHLMVITDQYIFILVLLIVFRIRILPGNLIEFAE
ncbi:hypothetical protein BN1007_70070 [Klebsiella variicola]|nr:hypothetical protein BN1007_70070 [Klebsiella variicola]CTQ15278.1 hypothetical protein BN1007_70522 [Klebsiella variicola]